MNQLEQAIRDIVAKEVAIAEKRIRSELSLAADKDLSFAEACEYLNMSEYTLRKLIHAKRIPHRIYGAAGSKNPRYLFSRQRLDLWKREEEERNYIRLEEA